MWVLNPPTLEYEVGRPGLRAAYVIELAAYRGGYLFHLDGDDADGNPMKFSNGGAIDGLDREIPCGFTLAFTCLGARSIDATIRFTQFRTGPDARACRNRSLYRRLTQR
jgi:hypothetical protein